jgi:signal transduction histidine kinase
MTRTALRLDSIAADVVESQRRTAQERGITIDARLSPVTVAGEQPLLERLVSNLVGNAVKYNDPGGSVTVALAPEGVLTVSNTGPVVAPEQVDGLFEPFRRLSGERLDHGGGVGLGLTIVRSIVAAHRGSVHAIANPGGGLTVHVRLITVAG